MSTLTGNQATPKREGAPRQWSDPVSTSPPFTPSTSHSLDDVALQLSRSL